MLFSYILNVLWYVIPNDGSLRAKTIGAYQALANRVPNLIGVITRFFLYKNHVYKNIEAQISQKIRTPQEHWSASVFIL